MELPTPVHLPLSWVAETIPFSCPSNQVAQSVPPPGRWPEANALALAFPFTHFPEPPWQEGQAGEPSVGQGRWVEFFLDLHLVVSQQVALPGPALGLPPAHSKHSITACRTTQISRAGVVPVPPQARTDAFSTIHKQASCTHTQTSQRRLNSSVHCQCC